MIDVAPAPVADADAPATTDEPAPTWRLALPGMALAAVTAAIGLGQRSLWLDESLSLGATNQLVDTWRGSGGTMAIYYLLLDGWTTVGAPVWWVRALSVVCVVGALLPLVGLARRLGGDGLAVRAGLVAGVLPVATRYAQEARSYALVLLLVTTAAYCVVRGVEAEAADRDAGRWWRATTVLAVALVLGHGLTIVNVGTLVALVAVAPAPARSRALRGLAPALLAAVAVAALLWSAGADEVGAWVPALDLDQVEQVVRTYTSARGWAAAAVGIVLAVGVALSVRRARTAADALDRWRALVPVGLAVVPPGALLALSLVRPSMLDRYLIGIVPGLALLVAVAWQAVDRRLPRLGPVGLGGLVVALLLVVGQVDVHDRGEDDWRGAAAAVAADARPGDGVLFPRAYHRTPFEAAWREVDGVAPAPIDTLRPLGTVRRHDVPLAEDEVAERLRRHDRVWLITADEAGSRGDPVADLLADPATDGYVVADEIGLDGTVRVTLLERR